MILCAIVAMAENRVIGRDNRLPWYIPEDLKFFRMKTKGSKIIMGRKTYDSLGKPLPHRENIVLTRDTRFQAEGVRVFHDVADVLRYCADRSQSQEEVFVVGGAEIYRLTMPYLDRIYLTVVHRNYEGDTFFPEVDLKNEFRITEERRVEGDPSFTFMTAERTRQ